jgi:recombinational DNA repair ATPase RecF
VCPASLGTECNLKQTKYAVAYPEATKIRLVLYNLNTYNASAFYENLPADEAFALAQRFEFFYTPKSASWLNMIEIEFSALARLCLKRRIPTIEQLESELMAIIAERTQKRVKIKGQFSLEACRKKLNSRYSLINEANSKFKEL